MVPHGRKSITPQACGTLCRKSMPELAQNHTSVYAFGVGRTMELSR
jgi:hypothetical protein